MLRFRYRLATLFLLLTVMCVALGVGVTIGRRAIAQRRFVAYLHAEYGNQPWAGVRYDHETKIGGLYPRRLLDDVFHRVAEVEFHQTLEHDDDMAKKLSRVASIEALSFGESGLTNVGVSYLCRLKRLHSLEVPWSGIRDEGLHELALLPSLKYLDIRMSNHVTVEAVARFRKGRPDVRLLEDAWWTEEAESRARATESGTYLHEGSRD